VFNKFIGVLDKVTALKSIKPQRDFAKAFDKVPHQRLLRKLRAHGICGKILNWISAWLTNRRQRVCLQGELSRWLNVTSGVPHGSVFGPVSFLIFINDLDSGIANWILKFADDTKIYSCLRGAKDCDMLQDNLHIGKKNPLYSYKMNDAKLEEVTLLRKIWVYTSAAMLNLQFNASKAI